MTKPMTPQDIAASKIQGALRGSLLRRDWHQGAVAGIPTNMQGDDVSVPMYSFGPMSKLQGRAVVGQRLKRLKAAGIPRRDEDINLMTFSDDPSAGHFGVGLLGVLPYSGVRLEGRPRFSPQEFSHFVTLGDEDAAIVSVSYQILLSPSQVESFANLFARRSTQGEIIVWSSKSNIST